MRTEVPVQIRHAILCDEHGTLSCYLRTPQDILPPSYCDKRCPEDTWFSVAEGGMRFHSNHLFRIFGAKWMHTGHET